MKTLIVLFISLLAVSAHAEKVSLSCYDPEPCKYCPKDVTYSLTFNKEDLTAKYAAWPLANILRWTDESIAWGVSSELNDLAGIFVFDRKKSMLRGEVIDISSDFPRRYYTSYPNGKAAYICSVNF